MSLPRCRRPGVPGRRRFCAGWGRDPGFPDGAAFAPAGVEIRGPRTAPFAPAGAESLPCFRLRTKDETLSEVEGEVEWACAQASEAPQIELRKIGHRRKVPRPENVPAVPGLL